MTHKLEYFQSLKIHTHTQNNQNESDEKAIIYTGRFQLYKNCPKFA